MPEISTIYVDTCAFIDMAKHRARLALADRPNAQEDRERDVWTMKQLLAASTEGAISVLTSTLTITECVYLGVEPDKIPDALTQRFFSELLLSGKSGVTPASPSLSIMERARDLRWKKRIILKPMDSLHVATALHHHCREILTHDKDMHSDSVRLKLEEMGLNVVLPRDTALLPEKFRQSDLSDQ